MKYLLFFLSVIALSSCQKETSENGDEPGTPRKCRLVKMVQGVGVLDTVRVFNYDESGRLVQIINQRSADTLRAVYAEGFISQLLGRRISLTFGRNTAGKINWIQGWGMSTQITYADDSLYQTASSDGTDYVFELNEAHDIVYVKETLGAGITHEHRITYTDIPNTFASIDALNYQNILGMKDVNPLFSFGFAPTKLIKEHSYQAYRHTVEYEFDENDNVIKSVAARYLRGEMAGFYTRHYFYDCE